MTDKQKIKPKPKSERVPHRIRVFSYNFLQNLLDYISIENQRCVVPLADVNNLEKKYRKLFRRYQRLKGAMVQKRKIHEPKN